MKRVISLLGAGVIWHHKIVEALDTQKINTEVITVEGLKKYKTILKITNTHLQVYEPGSNIHITRGTKFRYVISKVYPHTRRSRGVEEALRQHRERH